MIRIFNREIKTADLLIFFGIATLLLLFCARIWNLGITHSDDANWYLAAINGNWNVITSWAINQGRIFAYFDGPLMYITLFFQGTVIGELLRIGSFLLFFVCFAVVISVYFGKKVAQLSAILNLALFAIRWDGSILTSYPTFSWLLGSLFLISIYIGNLYSKNRQRKYLYISLGTFFLSLFIHEGITVLFIILYFIAIFGNSFTQDIKENSPKLFLADKFKTNFIITACITALTYLVLYFSYRALFPSNYEGNSIGEYSLSKIFPIVLDFGTTGNIISDIFKPYAVNFVDNISKSNFIVTYNIGSFLNDFINQPGAMINALLVFVLIVIIFNQVDRKDEKTINYHGKFIIGIIVALFIAFIPHLPVSITEKYQTWYYELGIHSHVYTTLSHFGISFGFAICILWLVDIVFKKTIFIQGFVVIIASTIAVLSFAGFRMNDAIVNDIRTESYRWYILDTAMEILSESGEDVSTIYAPRFFGGSWYTVLDEDYWSSYLNGRYQKNISFVNGLLSQTELQDGIMYLDYFISDNEPYEIILLSSISILEDENMYYSDDFMVYLDNYEPSDIGKFVLEYTDLSDDIKIIPFSTMEKIDNFDSVFKISNIQAEPMSFYVFQQNYPIKLLVRCDDLITSGTIINFGTTMVDNEKACIEDNYLDTGWNQKEIQGVWSSNSIATINIPTTRLQYGDIKLTFELNTFSDLGVTQVDQDLQIVINDRIYYSDDENNKAKGFQPLEMTVPKTAWRPDEPLHISFNVEPMANPFSLGISTDSRDLGVYLRSIHVESISDIN